MTTIASLQPADKRPWYKEPWPWILMFGPFVVVVAGFVTAWLAIRSNDGLVEDDYYKQGLAINRQLERNQKAADLDLQAQVLRSGVQLRVVLTSAGHAQLPEKLVLRFVHPTMAGRDQLVELKIESQGLYIGKLNTEISGHWRVILEDPSGQWRLQGNWQTDAMESLRLGAGADASTINRNPVTGR